MHNQDLKIAALAWEAGRGLIIVVNKWDLAEKDDKASAHKFEKEAGEKAPFLKFVPFLFTSAITGQRVTRDARACCSRSMPSARSASRRRR